MFKYLRLYRLSTDTSLVVKSPFEFGHIDEGVALHLDQFVQYHFSGFELADFLTEEAKENHEKQLTAEADLL